MRYFSQILFLLLLFPVVIFANCPDDLKSWQDWQKEKTDKIFDSEFSQKTIKNLNAELLSCSQKLSETPLAKTCLNNFSRFVVAQSWETLKGHSLGNQMSDIEYYSNMPYPEMLEAPKELAENQEFLKLLDDRSQSSHDKALQIIEQINEGISDPTLKWISFIYDSQHLATPDQTLSMGRFFVYVPSPDFDRLIQFGLQRDPNRPIANSFSAVAIQKTDPLTKEKLKNPRTRLKDFWRLRKNGKILISTRLKEVGEMENCYNCHKSAALPITPNPTTFDSARFGESLKQMNRIMNGYAAADMDGYDMKAHGPSIGPEKSTIRTDDFIRSCSKGTVTAGESILRIQKAMTCSGCHNGVSRGALNYPSGMFEIPVGGTMVGHYVIKHKKMPLGNKTLTDIERKALVDCLNVEYYEGFDGNPGVFREWFDQKECWNF